MPITPGQRLGGFEVTGKLGEGGMGEVYRATDPALKREVAIKVLPATFASDPERLARFEREAQVLAQLSHPNIAAIFGLHDSDGLRFLAMEMVPGETLEERIGRGPVPTDEAIDIAKKIADGLEYAHERGIVHRDLKPANIKLTPEGDVKILDFGLAKAITGDVVASGPTSTPTVVPTMTSAGTAIGIILGTAAYMSPEQARGRPVDKRADIWAFGAVVYELITGKRLFEGETISDTIAAVLTLPIDMQGMPAAATFSLRRLLARCLERDPRLRLRDIGEARIALNAAATVETEALAAPPRRRRPIGWMIGVPLIIAAALLAAWLLSARPPVPALDARFALAIPDGLTVSTIEHVQLALSPDGKRQVAVVLDANAMPQLLLRSDDAVEPRLLRDSERAGSPFFSPQGDWIAFFRETGLYKLPVAGGPPIRLATISGTPRGGTWSRDGYIYVAPDAAIALRRVREDGGELEEVTRLDLERGERTHRHPAALPDGSAVLFTSDDQGSTEYYDDARIEVVRPSTGERKVLVEGASMARYVAPGHLVFARAGTLYAIRFDPKSLTTEGSPFPVVQGVATDISTGAVAFAISENGRAAWIPGRAGVSWRASWSDRQGAESSVAIPEAPYNELTLSPDGKRVALTGGQGGISDLWVFDFERDSMTRLTMGQYISRPVWSPDGKRIAYGTRLQGPKSQTNTWQLAWKPADGSSEQEPLLERERSLLPSSFTPDGRSIIFDAFDGGASRRDIWVLPVDGAREPRVLLGGPTFKYQASVSPDGKLIAYVSTEGGLPAVFVRPFPSGEARWQISTPQGSEPRWSEDGRELFYKWDGVLYAVRVDTSRGFTAGRPERLFDRVATGGLIATYGLPPDGKTIFTFRYPAGASPQRTVDLDLAFGKRLSEAGAP
jgi:serine/threonine-protein kinase